LRASNSAVEPQGGSAKFSRSVKEFPQMSMNKQKAIAALWRTMRWIVLLAVMTVIAALVFLSAFGELTTHMVVATTLGVFISMVLGCGLFALAFFSDKSGHDEVASNSTRPRDQEP
jgi:uncharacterized membrane protein